MYLNLKYKYNMRKYSLKFAPLSCFFNFIFHKQQRTIRKIYILSYPKGRQYDKDGNLKQWWTDDVIQKFKTQAQCLIDQYGDFSVPEADGMKVSRAQSEFPLNTLYRNSSLSKWFVCICFVLYRSQSMALCTDITNRNYRYNSYM